MVSRYVTRAEAELLDAFDYADTATVTVFAAKLTETIHDGKPHPFTRAAAFAEGASFETPIERGEQPAPIAPF